MELNRYIQHPELLDRETLYDLRSYVALYPYHQAARLLMLQNLYLLRDSSFGEELRQAAFFITDRTVLFNMIEGKHYQLTPQKKKNIPTGKDRTDILINEYLDSLPQEAGPEEKSSRKPTAADATVDYVSYLMETDSLDDEQTSELPASEEQTPKGNGNAVNIIDNFLEKGGGKIVLSEESTYTPHTEVEIENDKDELEESYFTETLAKIYIKQGNYSKALEIIQQLNLIFPKKSAYFADQMRYIEKIILIKS